MMLSHRFLPGQLLACLCSGLLLLLSACGGGNQVAGIDGSGAPIATNTRGTIDGFGSVIVNGVKYDSDKAEVWINGERGSEQQLRAGYQVSISGSINSNGQASAERIEFIPTLVGTISAIDINTKQLTVMGKTVRISNSTLFDAAIQPANITGLSTGLHIVVSGIQASDGSISATRIELASSQQSQLEGQIESLTAQQFVLRGIEVSYNQANFINLSAANLQNGASVTVIGNLSGNQLQAQWVIGLSKTLAPGKADIEGYITRFSSSSDFDVAGIRVNTTNQTRYEDGNAADLQLGIKIEVEGRVNSAGLLIAEEIEFEQASSNKISGRVSEVYLDNSQGIIIGRLVIDGLQVFTNSRTRYEDKLLQLQRFNLASINLNDRLEISGYTTSSGFIASKIERQEEDDDEDEQELEGQITEVGTDYIVVLNRTIYLTATTTIGDDDDVPLSLSEFLATALGQSVEVKGYWQADKWFANSIEIDD